MSSVWYPALTPVHADEGEQAPVTDCPEQLAKVGVICPELGSPEALTQGAYSISALILS